MKSPRLLAAAAALVILSVWLQREFARGTFDEIERRFAGWLAANTGATAALPPLVVVLYDEESSQLSGTDRLAMLDGALFARAAAQLGAVAAGVEGLNGNPVRMLEAAGRMPVFGGFDATSPPGNGWTTCEGTPDRRWPELPGLTGPSTARYARGFFAPPSGAAGPRRIPFVARHSDRPVASFLAMAWAAGQRLRPHEIRALPGRIEGRGRFVPLDSRGASSFFARDAARIMTMNQFLVVAERFERDGGESPLRGSVIVLCRATPDVARVASGGAELTPAELWAQSWQALRQGRTFVVPGWWYPLLVALVAVALCAGPARRGWVAVVGTGAAVLLAYLLAALAAFGTYGLLLPFVPSAVTMVAGLLLGRLFAPRPATAVP
jgi:hypothetical protein